MVSSDNIADIWEHILDYAKASNIPGFHRWLSEAMPQSVERNIFEIVVDRPFIKDWIEKKFAANIETELSSFCQQPMQLKVTCFTEEASAETEPTNVVPASVLQPKPPAPAALPLGPLNGGETFDDHLQDKYLFENFVIGNSNRFAFAAAQAVAENPAKVYNPLFLYSGVGLGKTHLMYAIGNRIKENHPEMKILYISSETFTNEMIAALQKSQMDKFRNRYRNIDVLLIDDIQFLQKKDATQEEFFHTFNALRDAGKQIIISSDRKPTELTTLEERLRSRFSWGLNADIQPPDVETRMAILRNMADEENIELPNDVALFIASTVSTNIRELEGAYIKVRAYSSVINMPITMETTRKALSELSLNNINKQITIPDIQQLVATHYKIKMDDFLAKKRTRNVAFPRQIAMYLCRELTDYSLPRIGEFFGGRDHTTVIHACEKISKDIKKDPVLEKIIDNMKQQLQK